MASSNAQTTVNVDVDPKVAAAVAAWATEVTARAVWTANGVQTPGWIAMVVALLDDLAVQLAQGDVQPVGTAGQAGTIKPTGMVGAHGAFLWGVLAGRVAPAAPPSPPTDAAPTEVPATMRALLEELGAARVAMEAADTLAVAQRVGDAGDVAETLATYEQASLAYHLVAGHRPGGEADGGAES
jgi:hypothetical protein